MGLLIQRGPPAWHPSKSKLKVCTLRGGYSEMYGEEILMCNGDETG